MKLIKRINQNDLGKLIENLKINKISLDKFNKKFDKFFNIIQNMENKNIAKRYAESLLFLDIDTSNVSQEKYLEYQKNVATLTDFINKCNLEQLQLLYDKGELDKEIKKMEKDIFYNMLSYEEFISYYMMISYMKYIDGFKYIKFAELLLNSKVICYDLADEKDLESMKNTIKTHIFTKISQ